MTPASLLKFRKVPPAWIIPSVLLAWVLHRYMPLADWLPAPWDYLSAALVWVASLMLTGTAARGLAVHKTSLYPNGESTALVETGVYRYTRNPMYLGMALMVLGAALFLGSLSPLLAVVFFCLMLEHLFIKPEEQRLEGWFGDSYRDYCSRVRRWL